MATFHFGANSQKAATQVAMSPWAYDAAFRIIESDGQVARMSDILAPLDKRTTIKVSLSKIANVYSTLTDAKIPMCEQSANTTGGTVFVELKTIATKTLDDGTVIQLPLVGRMELRVPYDSAITEDDIVTLAMATYAGLCDDAGRPVVISEKLRGALAPAGI